MLIKTFKECLPYIFQAKVAPMVIGHHGIGKSQAVKQFADEHGYGFVDLRLGTQDVGDLLGLADFERDDKGNLVATKFFRPDWFPYKSNDKVIIFLDEINRARRDVLQAVFQLVLDLKLHRYKLPEQCRVMSAMNPNTDDYIVTDISDRALMDRFLFIKLTPSKEEFYKFMEAAKCEPELIQFLREQPEMVETKLQDFSLRDMVKPSRRSWMFVNHLFKLQKAGMQINYLKELASGMVGLEAATAFLTSLKTIEKPLSGEQILKEYPKHKKRLKKFSDRKTGGRADLIHYSCDNLKEVIQHRNDKKI